MGESKRPIQTNDRNIRTIHGRITNSGTPVITEGQGFSISDDGVGVVTVSLNRPGRSLHGASVTVLEATAATAHYGKATVWSAAAVTFNTFVADGVDGAPADVDFAFSITVKDSQ